MRIRQGNDFIFLWAIERDGQPEDFSNAENIRLHFKNFDCVGEVESFQIVDGNIVRVEVSPEWASQLGAYRLILSYEFEDESYSDGDQKCVVDVLAFNIVPKTSEADDLTEMAKTTDIMIGLRGSSAYEVWLKDNPDKTKEDYYNWLQKPATDIAETVSLQEQARAEAEELRVLAEELRQTNTATAISNAENATENANTAAQNADDARLAIQDDLALKADQADLVQLAGEVSDLNKPIATYTYDLNPEKTITSIDVVTGTFTSASHGLANGNMVSFAKNKTTLDARNPLYFLPNGVTISNYYVINATTDTFQISTAIGGSALVMTSNATMDLTKVHLEILSAKSVTIRGLPVSGNYKANLRLNCTARTSAGVQFRPTTYIQERRWLTSTGSTNFGGITFIDVGGVLAFASLAVVNAEFSLISGHKNAIFKGLSSVYKEASLVESSSIDLALSEIVPNSTADITSITVASGSPSFYILNGTTIEVYKL